MPPIGSPATSSLQQKIDAFVASGGHWPAALAPLVDSCPDFVLAYLDFAGSAYQRGPLEPKVKALVSLALDASVTHLYAPGIRRHCRDALRFGATKEELFEVLQLISVIGVHACVIGMPALEQKLTAYPGQALDLTHADTQRQSIKREFAEKRGYWSPIWDGLLALDPDYFQSFTTFSSVPWVAGTLPPKVKEFVYIAVDVSVTHQYVPGTHVHIENALKYGASAAEVLEVMQLASSMGIHSFEVALPIVIEELARAQQ
jgi:alkylhydroperoxidase/carboxymuconolactone decarboxylase family protein YurZ